MSSRSIRNPGSIRTLTAAVACILAASPVLAGGLRVRLISPKPGEELYPQIEDLVVMAELRWEGEAPRAVRILVDGKAVGVAEVPAGDGSATIRRVISSDLIGEGAHTVEIVDVGSSKVASSASGSLFMAHDPAGFGRSQPADRFPQLCQITAEMGGQNPTPDGEGGSAGARQPPIRAPGSTISIVPPTEAEQSETLQ